MQKLENEDSRIVVKMLLCQRKVSAVLPFSMLIFTAIDIFRYLDPDPDSHHSQNSGAAEAQKKLWRAWEAYNGCGGAQNGALKGLQTNGRRFVVH